jgi:ABC-type antimicrobial peptide transport system permease subunit
MYYRLALKNLLSQKLRTILTTLGLCVGIASLVVFTGLSAGLHQAIYANILSSGPLTELTVQAKNSGNSLLNLLPTGGGNSHITPEQVANIQKIPHVTKVYPEMNYGDVSSLQLNIVGQTFQTDTMIFGLPQEYIQDTLSTPELQDEWNSAIQNYPASPYPAIISRRIIDLYNFTIAASSKLPHLSEQELTGLPLTLLPDQSTLFNNTAEKSTPLAAKLVGFSDKTSLVGVTLPLDVVRRLNLARDPNYKDSYLHLYVEIDNAENMDSVQKAINALGLDATSAQQQIQSFEQNFRFVNFGLSLISIIILIVAGLMIANTFFSATSERKSEIGIFRALGATRTHIQMMFLTEAGLLGVIGGITGIIIGLIGEVILNLVAMNILPDVTNKPSTIFINDWASLLGIFVFSILISMLFAFIPANQAAHLEPLEALNE